MSEVDIKKLVDKFLSWPLPASVCSDLCATQQGAPHRSGTTLLSAVEAKQMLEYLLADMAPPAVWSRERPTEPGLWWYRAEKDFPGIVVLVEEHEDGAHRKTLFALFIHSLEMVNTIDMTGEFAGPLRPPVEET